jgi:hypothetical protein
VSRMGRRATVIALSVSLLFLSGSVGVANGQGSKVSVREILPSKTDSRIDMFSGDGWDHCVYYQASAAKKHQLLVFLPGTGGKGHGAVDFCTLAASQGFHVVSLAYPSSISISVYHSSTNPDAFLKARENILYGKAPFQKLTVNEPNSIQNRLVKVVQYLAKRYPNEGWNQFLDRDDSLLWSKLVLTGQSQGGGHAAVLAMQHEVARVLMFGSPKDFNIHFQKPAKWYSAPSATPLDRFFSFVHDADEGHGCTYPQQLENYRAMKLMPRYRVINVDQASPPYQHTRLLTSSRSVKNPHASVISNGNYANVWAYMLKEKTEE